MTIQHLFPTSKPILDLNFAAERQLDPRIDFTRSTVGTYVDKDGIVQTGAVDKPRFEYDFETGESLGLLIEESRTNLHPNSTVDALNAGIVGLIKGSTSTIDPTGATSTVETRTVSSDVSAKNHHGNHFYNNTYIDFTWSLFVKANGINRIQVSSSQRDNSSYIDVNLATGEIEEQTALRSTLTKLANGWYRISVSRGSDRAHGPGFWLLDDSGNRSFVGDGTSGVYVWGIQLEQADGNLFPTSYIATSGSSVSRAADVADITGTNFSSWYNQNEGTVCCDFYSETASGLTSNDSGSFIYSLHEASGSTNRINASIRRDGTTSGIPITEPFIEQNGVTELTADLGEPIVYGEVYKTALSIGIGEGGFTTQGVNKNLTAGPPSALPAVTILTLGDLPIRYDANKRMLNGHIGRLAYYPQSLSDEQLQALTA